MKILCIAAHTDDVEISCGGSVVRFLEEGNDIYYAAFSIAEDSLPKGLAKDILVKEMKEATKILGIRQENLRIYKYPVRYFPHFRQEILEDLVKLNEKIRPDLVLIPSKYDTHQDHHTIAMEGFRAFRFTSILGYETLQSCVGFETSAFIILNEHHLKKKIAAVNCYKSQKIRIEKLGRKHILHQGAEIASQMAGFRIGEDYAEAFNVVRWVIR